MISRYIAAWAAIAAVPTIMWAAAPKECVATNPTPRSYTWNFDREASGLLKGIRSDAVTARTRADKLMSFERNPMDWQIHADQLTALKREVDDMGARLCRLETIHRVITPAEERQVKRVAPLIQYMADNTDDALNYLNAHRLYLWAPSYHEYATNLYHEAGELQHVIQVHEG